MSVQSLETIGTAKESTFGTFVAPTNFVPGTADINTNTKSVRPTQSRGTRAQVVDAIVGLEAGITINAELIPEVLSNLEAAWFGTGSDSKSGSSGVGFTHALTPQNQLPSLSVEVAHDLVNQVLVRQLVGCQVDQIQFRAQAQQLATIQAQLIAQREITPATPSLPSNPTPSISALQPMSFDLLAATYKAVATTQLQDLTLTMMNKVQRVFTNNGKLYVSRLQPTLREIQLQTTLDFLDTTFYSDWIQGVKTTGMVLTMTTANNIAGASNPYVVEHTLPGLRPVGQYNLQNASDVLNQQIQWSATLSGSNEISARWVNGEAATLPV